MSVGYVHDGVSSVGEHLLLPCPELLDGHESCLVGLGQIFLKVVERLTELGVHDEVCAVLTEKVFHEHEKVFWEVTVMG